MSVEPGVVGDRVLCEEMRSVNLPTSGRPARQLSEMSGRDWGGGEALSCSGLTMDADVDDDVHDNLTGIHKRRFDKIMFAFQCHTFTMHYDLRNVLLFLISLIFFLHFRMTVC